MMPALAPEERLELEELDESEPEEGEEEEMTVEGERAEVMVEVPTTMTVCSQRESATGDLNLASLGLWKPGRRTQIRGDERLTSGRSDDSGHGSSCGCVWSAMQSPVISKARTYQVRAWSSRTKSGLGLRRTTRVRWW